MTYHFFNSKKKAKLSPKIFVLSIFLSLTGCNSDDEAEGDNTTPIETRETLNGEGTYNDSKARIVENLNRGLIAVKSEDGILLSWRLLGTEYDTDIAFDIYKNGKKINDKPVTDSTNFLDKDANFTNDVEYKVQAIVNGNHKLALSKAALLLKDGYLNIPLKAVDGEYYIHHAWPGDVDGDGEYEYIVSRLPRSNSATLPSFIEAYKLDGTFLWRVNMGINSYQKQDGIAANDGAAAAISGFGATAGYRNDDLVTVYDLDSDGKAEVLVRTATGTTFADGTTILEENTGIVNQYISVIDGQSGKEKTRAAVPDDLKELGPVGGHFAIAYLDGKKPSLITKLVARAPGKNGSGFQWYMTAWNYENGQLTRRWHWNAPTDEATRLEYRFHQMRIVDLDQDGKDEIIDGNYVINDDGTLLYIIDEAIHGDRFHIGDFDPDHPGLEGYAIQQTEVGKWTKFPWYYYDATTGVRLVTGKHPFENPDKSNKEHERLWDVPRGTIADIDPRYNGFEFWASMSDSELPGAGLFNVNGTKISSTIPSTTNFRIYWDADEGDELLDGTRIWKWDYINSKDNLIFQIPNVVETPRVAQPFYGDILGDWREEILIETDNYQNLRLYSTPIKTDKRHYTLAHNPEYRLGFTTKGYVQSNHLDYYFGWNMPKTPKPKIRVLFE